MQHTDLETMTDPRLKVQFFNCSNVQRPTIEGMNRVYELVKGTKDASAPVGFGHASRVVLGHVYGGSTELHSAELQLAVLFGEIGFDDGVLDVNYIAS